MLTRDVGDSGMTDYNIRNTKVSSQDRTNVTTLTEESQTHFQVYFPSDRTAHAAHRDPHRTAGTVCFQKKWWDGAKFPRRVMKDCESHRGVLMHNKVRVDITSNRFKCEQYSCYDSSSSSGLLSHSYSMMTQSVRDGCTSGVPIFRKVHGELIDRIFPSLSISSPCMQLSWNVMAYTKYQNRGRLVKDRATGQPKLNFRNWECGVLVPVTNPDEESKSDNSSQSDETVRASSKPPAQYLPAEVFQNTVPVPMKLPAAQLKEGREPWFLRWN